MAGPIFLNGQKINLRTIEEEDLKFVQESLNEEDMRRPLLGHYPTSFEDEEEFYEKTKREEYNVLIVSKSNQNFGLIALRNDVNTENAEITVWITPSHQGKGFGEEASRLMTRFGFQELDYHRIYARILASNEPSKHLFEKIGYKKEGSKREAFFTENRYEDIELYSILHQEWNDRD